MTKTSEKYPFSSQFIEVEGAKMHFVEVGSGNPILFLHGVPTSSYLWRHIIPHLSQLGRCIAVDLIGFGKSDKPDIEYSIFDHIKYIDIFIKQLKLTKLTLVMHGWGSIIGLDYAMRNEKTCKGLVFYEAFLRPFDAEEEIALPFQEQLQLLKAETEAENVPDGIAFVEQMLSQGLMQGLSEEELEHYRQPFRAKKSEKPILQYLKELPDANSKTKVNQLIRTYSQKLTRSSLPKLLLYTVPGFITTIDTIMWAKENLPNLEVIDLGEELHLAQESYPDLMGENISVWMQGVEQSFG